MLKVRSENLSRRAVGTSQLLHPNIHTLVRLGVGGTIVSSMLAMLWIGQL